MSKNTLRLTVVLGLSLCAPALFGAPSADDAVAYLPSDTMSESELADQSGLGASTVNQLAVTEESASVNNNQLTAGTNGNNVIDGNSFSGISGIATVIQNSGNQVVIQGSTAVNVVYTP